MDQKGSTPDNQSDQQDHSSNDQSAEIVDNSQPSQDGRPQFYETNESQDEEEQDSEGGAPSQSQDDNGEEDEGDGQEDSNQDLERWAKSQNIDLDSPSAIKLAQRLRDTQKALHEKSNESKQKFNEASTEGLDTNTRLEAKLARMDFFEAHPEARELEGEMYDIAIEAKESGDMAGFAYYQTPQGWNVLHALAKTRAADSSSEEQYEAGRKDERTNLAKKQQASTARRSATDSAPDTGRPSDDQIGNMQPGEYTQFRKDNPNWNPFTGWAN